MPRICSEYGVSTLVLAPFSCHALALLTCSKQEQLAVTAKTNAVEVKGNPRQQRLYLLRAGRTPSSHLEQFALAAEKTALTKARFWQVHHDHGLRPDRMTCCATAKSIDTPHERAIPAGKLSPITKVSTAMLICPRPAAKVESN